MSDLFDALNRQREKLLDGETYDLSREELTELYLSQSLCPIHVVDYAICFEYPNPECEQVRLIHPGHDT